MTLFILFIVSWLVTGLLINIGTRILLRTRLQSYAQLHDVDAYTQGYGTGITNLKMYYYSTGEIPSVDWLQTNMKKILNTREKLEATLNEEDRSKVYISELQNKWDT